jgi:hypothetical protein
MIVRLRCWPNGSRGTAALACGLLVLLFQTADAQLRIVSYNTAGGPRTGMDVILESIGEEEVNGIQRPIDVLLLQEQNAWETTTTSILGLLNGIYGSNTYSLVELNGGTEGAGRPGLIFKNSTIQVVDSTAFGTVGGTEQARQTLRYHLRPIGYDSSYDFYAYNSHYKAAQGSANEARRLVEATEIRDDADLLGQGKHIIYAGDHNVYTSSEPAIQELLAPGEGQARDPINRLGSWSNISAFADVHTQAPCLTACSLVDGGMDDRFDFQFLTGEFFDGNGLDYIPGSYRAFGNGGNVFNMDVNVGCNTMGGCTNSYSFTGVGSHSKKDILDALHSTSDHLPVVVDYTLTGGDPQPLPEVLARWTFETGTSGNPPSGSGATITGIAPVDGSGTASGVHTNPTTWSNPAGNGSPDSFSSTQWSLGNYYQFQTSSDGFEDLSISFDHVSSATGPEDFQLSYSIDGMAFTNFGDAYEVRENNIPAWAAGTPTGIDTFAFDLSSVMALDDKATIYFRLATASTEAAGGGAVTGGGTSRVDNVTIMGVPILGLDGDFNHDGFVDAADYVMWRKTNSGDMIAYNTWVQHFGESLAGSGGGNGASANAPEPGTWLLMTVFAGCLLATRRVKLAGWTRPR